MTAFYVRPAFIIDGTRMHGFVELVQPLVNWLAGTTDEWMQRSIPKDAVEGGFVARVQVVRGQRNYAVRYPQMIYPPDYAEVRAYLKRRLEALLLLEEAEFILDEEARQVHDDWYMNAQPPEDSVLLPSFNRADDLIYKLSLILALAEWPGFDSPADEDGNITYDCTIHKEHVLEAIELWNSLVGDIHETVAVANSNPQTTDVRIVADAIRKAGRLGRAELQRKVIGRGINKERLDKALETLKASDEIEESSERGSGARMKVWYTWTATI
jgi:hypothetical protein